MFLFASYAGSLIYSSLIYLLLSHQVSVWLIELISLQHCFFHSFFHLFNPSLSAILSILSSFRPYFFLTFNFFSIIYIFAMLVFLHSRYYLFDFCSKWKPRSR